MEAAGKRGRAATAVLLGVLSLPLLLVLFPPPQRLGSATLHQQLRQQRMVGGAGSRGGASGRGAASLPQGDGRRRLQDGLSLAPSSSGSLA